MVDISQYKVGVIVHLEGCSNSKTKNGKALKACKVDIGQEKPVTVVTSASNVRDGSRVVVALAGTTYVNSEGEEVPVKNASVGGVVSEGMLCDSRMLGWSGGGSGVAAQVPSSFDVGTAPPAAKPRQKEEEAANVPQVKVDPLFEKKLSKEEKKALAEERRRARKAAKEAKTAVETSGSPSSDQ